MIIIKFIGGAKKSFSAEQMQIDKSDITIQKLLDLLLELKPIDTPKFDTENILIAINGIDSSAMDGRSTILKHDDLISIIPVIHGGSLDKRLIIKLSRKWVQVVTITKHQAFNANFLDTLRKKYSNIKLQAISSNFVINKYHLEKILTTSFESEKHGILLSNKIEIDILMRFALTSQISVAIENAGISPKTNSVLIGIGNKRSLDLLYNEMLPLYVKMFSSDNKSFLKKHFKITKHIFDSIHSNHPLEDILIERAVTLI